VLKWSGREARALREALRMSVRAFAAHLGVAERTVTKWETAGGSRVPRPDLQAVLDTALQRAPAEVQDRFAAAATRTEAGRIIDQAAQPAGDLQLTSGEWNAATTEALASFLTTDHDLTPDAALRLSQEWRIVEPPQVVELRAGRRVGQRLADAAIERVDVLRRMDDFLGGGDMHDLVRRELRVTMEAVRDASYNERTGRALLAAVGELCQLAGWVASDAGLHHLAERYYLGGVSAAHAARDAPLGANLLSSLAYQVANVGDPREAVLLASTAHSGAESCATPTVRALLLERVAWAYARLGDPRAAEAALAQVDDVFADSNPADDPVWAYWLNRDEIEVMAGRCLTQFRRATRAIDLLTRAVGRYDESHARELALYLTWLAEAHVYAGDVEEAATQAGHALGLAEGVASERAFARLVHVRRLLAPHRGNAAVDEFEEQARDVLDRATRQ
jgi:transcriptional regulator with XRE-family HTH domain